MNSPVPAWWNRLTYAEQTAYLQEHPQSQLHVTRRPSNKPQNPAHKAKVGDRVIICAYAHYSEAELANFQPRVLYMGADGELSHTSNAIPVQVA